MSARRTRVLHVIQNLNYGGMERLLADIVRRDDPARFENHVMALQYLGRFAEGLGDVAELHLARPMGRASMLWPRALAEQMRRIAPDVVHTHSGVWYKAGLAARHAGVPRLIHTEHGRERPDPWTARMIDGLAARRTDVVVAVSEVLARQLADTVVRGAARIHVVRNGVDTELHRPRPDSGAIRTELGIAADRPILGSIGRLEPIKGYDVMIEAFARLLADWPDDAPRPALLLAGEGSERPALERRAAELGLAGDVRFLGWRDDVADLHSAFALFTMSSRSEGTSVSLLEAMSAGLCPVVTDVGGNAAVLGPALRHRLVPAEDPAALAAAWRDALEAAERRREDGARARQRVMDEFSLATMVRAYEALYEGRLA
ncbi:MAG TPA: glycosyltransferase [Gemmatimonadaceae bacterium]|nr:glycosyltransferase [Gemmatimonadaceae bacterium]